MDRGWKQFERRLSRDMGVERQPVTGERNGADNAPHGLFCFQFKLRRCLPAWLFTWLDGIALAAAAQDGKIGVLVLKRPRMEDADALVVLRWRDWVDLHGPTKFGDRARRARPPRADAGECAALSDQFLTTLDMALQQGDVEGARRVIAHYTGGAVV